MNQLLQVQIKDCAQMLSEQGNQSQLSTKCIDLNTSKNYHN